jgi:hypothetical protein
MSNLTELSLKAAALKKLAAEGDLSTIVDPKEISTSNLDPTVASAIAGGVPGLALGGLGGLALSKKNRLRNALLYGLLGGTAGAGLLGGATELSMMGQEPTEADLKKYQEALEQGGLSPEQISELPGLLEQQKSRHAAAARGAKGLGGYLGYATRVPGQFADSSYGKGKELATQGLSKIQELGSKALDNAKANFKEVKRRGTNVGNAIAGGDVSSPAKPPAAEAPKPEAAKPKEDTSKAQTKNTESGKSEFKTTTASVKESLDRKYRVIRMLNTLKQAASSCGSEGMNYKDKSSKKPYSKIDVMDNLPKKK